MARSPIYKPFDRRDNAAIIRRIRQLARAGECDRAKYQMRFLSHRIKESTAVRLRRVIDRCRVKGR